MQYGVQIDQHGGPERLSYREIEIPTPRPGEVLVRVHAAGLNYIDTYHRTGYYPVPELPTGLGVEGAGVVEETGRRVAFAVPSLGTYQQYRCVPEDQLVDLPPQIAFEDAAAMMLKGMTARYLLRQTYPVSAGDTILVHAAAGGVGLVLCQWAAYLGVTVIGTVGSEDKARLARENGCTHPILYRSENVVERVKQLTDGRGVDVVYDSVGKDTFEDSLRCLRPRGLMVTFGQSSGPVAGFDPVQLSRNGSLFLTRPTLFHYVAQREELEENSSELFDVVLNGHVKIPVRQRYPLKDAAQAHDALEARRTTGSTVLIVD
jgi:NADPH2:quinone reductase